MKISSRQLDDAVAQWINWCDQEPAALRIAYDVYDLPSLMRSEVESVDAIDHEFYQYVIEAMTSRDTIGVSSAEHRAKRPMGTPQELEELADYAHEKYRVDSNDLRPDAGSHVQIISDFRFAFSGGNAAEFVDAYVKTLPPGWSNSVVVALRIGAPPTICRWTEQRIKIEATRSWCAAHPERTAEGHPRFAALESYYFRDDCRVLIPASVRARPVTVEGLAAPPKVAPAVEIHPTGIAPLDAALATGGIPTGARVVVQAPTEAGKTALMLEIAESFAARQVMTVWYATPDDSKANVVARRRQRMGMPQADALTSTDESMLPPGVFVVDGNEHKLEEVLACPGIGLLVLDPITKVATQCASQDPVARVAYALDLVERSGVTCLMAVPFVRGAGRRSATERGLGGARIEAGATVLLELARSGSNLTIQLVKSRLGGGGTEVAVRLDRERQRIIVPPTSEALPARARILRDVQAVLAERGPLSVRALAERWVTGRASVIRSVIREAIGAGQLRGVEGGKVSL